MCEQWATPPEYPTMLASDLGRIKGPRRHILKVSLNPQSGYPMVQAKSKRPGKIQDCVYVHRLVASAFIRQIDQHEEVNHKNGTKYDNRLANLEIVTRKENGLHASRHGLLSARRILCGSEHGMHELTEVDVINIRRLAATKTTAELVKMFGKTKTCIDTILRGDIWKCVTGGIPVASRKRHGRWKVTTSMAVEIREMLATGACHASVAERFGVSKAVVSQINTGKTWEK